MRLSSGESGPKRLGLLRQVYWEALKRWRFYRTSSRNTQVRSQELSRRSSADTLRVIWVLAGNRWVGSARLKGVVLDTYFRRENSCIFSRIGYMPPEIKYPDMNLTWRRRTWTSILKQGIDVVCFQTRKGATETFLKDCRASGVATVFSISDLDIESVPGDVWKLSDAVVASSEPLAQEVGRVHPRVVLIDDPIDVPEEYTMIPSSANGRDLTLVWTGHQDRWSDVAFVRQVLECDEFTSFCLKTITRHPQATHQWTPTTVWDDARRGDVAVLPAELTERGAAKSSNRLACFMALGFPVIATPIPAYTAHIRHGENGFLATTVEEWRGCLRQLRDPTVRKRVGENARNTASIKALRIPEVAAQWRQLFESLVRERHRGE